jgi:hypothetical protein
MQTQIQESTLYPDIIQYLKTLISTEKFTKDLHKTSLVETVKLLKQKLMEKEKKLKFIVPFRNNEIK